jgi:hypothetical protein
MQHVAQHIQQEMIPLSKELLELTILSIDKTINIMIKKPVLQAYRDGLLIPYITSDSFIYPATIPILMLKRQDANKYTGIINLSHCVKLTKSITGEIESVTVNDKKLFTYLCTAWLYRNWLLNPTRFTINVPILKVAADMYSRIVYKTLDRKYAIGVDYAAMDICAFILGYFFLSYQCEVKNALDIAETITNIRDRAAIKNVSDIIRTSVDRNTPPFQSFNDLPKLLNDKIKNIAQINSLLLISAFSQQWQGASVPALDFFPYFAMLIFSSYIGGTVANDLGINSLIRIEGEQFMKILSEVYRI